MSTCIIEFCGEEVHLHGEKLLWIPGDHILCAADIHFEKGTFFDRFGTFLPPYDTEAMLTELEYWIHHFKPQTFIALGDSFHDAKAGERLSTSMLNRLNTLITHVPNWIWIIGNHDPDIHADIAGVRVEEYAYRKITFRHAYDSAKNDGEISGHYHPKIRVTLRGISISAPCFVQRENRLILPSFGTYTGGLYVHDAAFLSVMPADEKRRLYFTYKGNIFLKAL